MDRINDSNNVPPTTHWIDKNEMHRHGKVNKKTVATDCLLFWLDIAVCAQHTAHRMKRERGG